MHHDVSGIGDQVFDDSGKYYLGEERNKTRYLLNADAIAEFSYQLLLNELSDMVHHKLVQEEAKNCHENQLLQLLRVFHNQSIPLFLNLSTEASSSQ